ncbi:MAG: hypothetical protein HY609_02175 [Deltaproteobacteria bacterium]|nr:hypothetical protein [Deltaproteobacteria bacterium]MBI4223715.1 hypothetical protein [Deltaproteobacteria bacterium]
MINFNYMAEKPKFVSEIPPQEAKEMEAWFEKLEAKLKNVPPEEIEKGAQKIKDFLDGKIGWADVFHFTPEQAFQIAEMGYNHFKLGRYQDAERFFKVLTILDWDNFYYHSMLGSILQRQKRDGEAIVEYSQAIESNPQDIVSLTNRGEIFMKHGWTKDAQRDFEKAIDLDPKGENQWANRSKTLLAEVKKPKKEKKK